MRAPPDPTNAKAPGWEEGGFAETTEKFRPASSTAARRSNQEIVATDTGDGYRALVLLEELDVTRDRFERGVALLERAEQLRESLWWQPDLDDARDAVAKLCRDVEVHRRGGGG